MQAQREFANSQMVIKPSFLRSAGERGVTEIELKRQRVTKRYRKQVFSAKNKKRHFLISFLQLAAQLMWNKKKRHLLGDNNVPELGVLLNCGTK